MTLNHLQIGQVGCVLKINESSNLYQRFLDIGITENSTIECVLESPWNNPRAYRIKGATIAIRNEDAEMVVVKEKTEGVNE